MISQVNFGLLYASAKKEPSLTFGLYSPEDESRNIMSSVGQALLREDEAEHRVVSECKASACSGDSREKDDGNFSVRVEHMSSFLLSLRKSIWDSYAAESSHSKSIVLSEPVCLDEELKLVEDCNRGLVTQDLQQLLKREATVVEERISGHGFFERFYSWILSKYVKGYGKSFYALAMEGTMLAFIEACKKQAEECFEADSAVSEFVKERLMNLFQVLEEQTVKDLSKTGSNYGTYSKILENSIEKIQYGLRKDPFFVSSTFLDGLTGQNLSLEEKKQQNVDILTMAVHSFGVLKKFASSESCYNGFQTALLEEFKAILERFVQFSPIDFIHSHCIRAGLLSGLLETFGQRAANLSLKNKNLRGETSERSFWVRFSLKLLSSGLEREGVSSILKTEKYSEESCKYDLPVLGFFAALGKSAMNFLAAKGLSEAEITMTNLLRYLQGASILYFPELGNLLRYQHFLDVAVEEMKWLPFLPDVETSPLEDKPPITKRHLRQAFLLVIQSVDRWIEDFSQFNHWTREAPNSSAAQFLKECKYLLKDLKRAQSKARLDAEIPPVTNEETSGSLEIQPSENCKEMELEDLNPNLWLEKVTNFDSGSSRNYLRPSNSSPGKQKDFLTPIPESPKSTGTFSNWDVEEERNNLKLKPFIRIRENRPNFFESPMKGSLLLQKSISTSTRHSSRFEPSPSEVSGWSLLTVPSQESSGFLDKSVESIKESTAQAWRGVKLLFTDVFAAVQIVKRGVVDRNWTERERKLLKRTAVDVATIIPISIILAIPMTPVGHGAVLAAIKKWMPFLIPSSFSDERMEVARQLEAMNSLASQIHQARGPYLAIRSSQENEN